MKNLTQNIQLPRLCYLCWRPIITKNKLGRFDTYCSSHKPQAESKKEYMRMRRSIERCSRIKTLQPSQTNKYKKRLRTLDDVLLSLVPDPTSLSFSDIKTCKGLINELLRITIESYPLANSILKQLDNFKTQPNMSLTSLILAIHYLLGTRKKVQALAEIQVYDLKKESRVWFLQLLMTVARYECVQILCEKSSVRLQRKDLNVELRQRIRNELERFSTNSQKPNQAEIARKLNISKQRVGQIIKELQG